MNKIELICQVEHYLPFDQTEKEMAKRFLVFIKEHEDCFLRSLLIGHVTASALVLKKNKEEVLLMHHKKLDKWLQPGGHCDGEEDVLSVAKKEVLEETGIDVGEQGIEIFDIDIHHIPERKGVPAHEHYDIRFCFIVANETKFIANNESNALKWIKLNDIEKYTSEPSILRMVAKVTS